MGNCQAVDAAALVIQHPSGKIERMYWSLSASEVMNINPGHYVSLIIPLPNINPHDNHNTVRFTRVKLLRPTDTLILGHAYRLLTSQEVMKVLKEKRYAKTKKNMESRETQLQTDLEKQSSRYKVEDRRSEMEMEETCSQVLRHERHRHRTAGYANIGATRSKSWRPSLQSISEAAS